MSQNWAGGNVGEPEMAKKLILSGFYFFFFSERETLSFPAENDHFTVKPRHTGPKSNGNPLITNAKV